MNNESYPNDGKPADGKNNQRRKVLSTLIAIALLVIVTNIVLNPIRDKRNHSAFFSDRVIRKEAAEVKPRKVVCNSVDLGLSVDWGDRNLGAIEGNSNGYYLSWGDIDYNGKKVFSKDSYYSKKAGIHVPKNYNTQPCDTLDAEDDIASVLLNKQGEEEGWRLPTKEEFKELLDNCEWKIDGSKGYRVTSKINHCSIFFPFSGYRMDKGIVNEGLAGRYWTSTVSSGSDSTYMNAYALDLDLRYYSISDFQRYLGMSVRPVKEKDSLSKHEE